MNLFDFKLYFFCRSSVNLSKNPLSTSVFGELFEDVFEEVLVGVLGGVPGWFLKLENEDVVEVVLVGVFGVELLASFFNISSSVAASRQWKLSWSFGWLLGFPDISTITASRSE